MRYERLMIMAIFLIAVLSIGAASAANQTDDSIASVDDIGLSDVGDSSLGSENVEVLSSVNQTVTPDNFLDYFDSDGNQKTTDDNLVFEGEFNGPVSHITINSPKNIYGQNAVFNNMGIKITGSDVTVNGLTLNSNQYVENEEGALIYAKGSGITLQNIILNYNPGQGQDAYGIFFSDCEDFELLNSQITFEANNSGGFYEYGIKMVDSNQGLIQGNLINVTLPLIKIDYNKEGLDQDYPLGIGIGSCEDIMIKNNCILANANRLSEDYATLTAILVAGSSDIIFSSNNISENDFITPEGSVNCLYAFYLNTNGNVLIEKNNISVKTNGGTNEAGSAYAIQSMVSDINVTGNNLTCVSKGPNIGVYMASFFGESAEGYIANNRINITGLATSAFWGLVTGVEIQNGDAKIYNNTVYTHTIGEYADDIYCYGISYSQWMYGDRSLDIQDNTVVTNGRYTISTIATKEDETTPIRIKNNNLTARNLAGDDSIQLCGESSTIPDDNGTDNGTDVNVTSMIDVNNVWIGNDNPVTVTIPNATGSVNITINGKSYSVDLTDGVATALLYADDLILGENTLTVRYNNFENSTTFKVLNGVITSGNVLDYFNQKNNGALDDCVPEGATLDFQGEIKAVDIGNFNITINKAVNIISSTQDSFIDLNTTASDRQGKKPGDKFSINKQGSQTNITGVTFHNTQIWIANADHVTLDDVSVIVENQDVGWGVGATSIRENSSYVTVKNSNFHTINSGGASTLVIAWANYCTFDNNTVIAEGDVGNTIYITTYNVEIPSDAIANVYNNVTNNFVRVSPLSAGICWGIVFSGTNNLIDNNTVVYNGKGITSQYNLNISGNNIFRNNNLSGGATMEVLPNSFVYDNYVSGALTLAENCIAYNNTAGGLVISGNNINAHDNIITGSVMIKAFINSILSNSNITGDIEFIKDSYNNTLSDNNITGQISVKGHDNIIKNNHIISNKEFAIVFNTNSYIKDNVVTQNTIYSSKHVGNEAVNDQYSRNNVFNNLPKTTELKADVSDIKVGEVEIVNITINDDATGSVKVVFNNVETPVEINNGFGQFTIPNLSAGSYSIKVIFTGDGVYNASEITKSFKVTKYDIPLEVEVNVPDRGNPSFTVDLASDATGNITVKINNKNYNETLVNGKATVTITDLQAGSYSATITYSGDNKYNSNSTTRSFIIKAEPAINVTVDDIRVGEVAYINVSVDARIANVTVVLNGEHDLVLNNGEGSLPVSGLGYGNYTVYVVFNGNSELLDKTVNKTFKVLKNDVSQDAITMENDFKDPKFTVTLNDDATGQLTVTINGNYYSQTVASGKATVIVSNLTSAAYNATVTYSGDDKYNPVSKTFSFIIKAEPRINIEAKDILVGETADINITANDGIASVKVILNGEQIVELTNGKGNVSVSGLSAGEYVIKVIFEGNDYFFAKNVTKNVTVSKHEITEDVFGQDGNNFTINLPADATGTFTIEIGVNTYPSSISQGKANVTVDDLNPGDYDVLMTYSGDDKYTNASKAATLNVPKWESAIEANVSDIKVGEDAVFEIEVTPGATGSVSIIINGKKYNGTLNNGKVQISVPGLSNDTYDALVRYEGDNNYLPSNITKTLNVFKVDIEGDWFTVGQSIVITLPSDATGKVTVNVNNNDIIEDVIAGKATITPDLTPGTYPITVKYSGDGKYNGIEGTSQMTVPKYDTPISASVNAVIVGETLKFTITVPNGATGNVSVVIKGVSYNGTINQGKAVVSVDGLPVGNYTAQINYPGDNNYSANSTQLDVKIAEKLSPNPDQAFVIPDTGSANPTFSIDLENATGNLTVYVDGKEYETVPLVDGKASINVTGLSSGSHTVTVSYSGDGRYSPISKEVTVNVPAPHVPVIKLAGSDVTMLYTSGSSYKVRLTSDGVALSGKTVVFTINGKTVKATTDKNGYASVKIDLPPKSAKYTVTATYNGVKTSNKVKVNGIVTAKNAKVKKSKKVNKIKVTLKKVNGKYLKGKKLTLKINGKKITAKTNKKGVATFKVKKNVVKKLKAGKKYKYTVTYLKETVTKKIKVKK